MYEYTDAYLTPFVWAKQAYAYMLEQIPNSSIQITDTDLISPINSNLEVNNLSIFTDADWNKYSLDQMTTLGGLYQSIDTADGYYNSLYTLINARLSESERRVQEQDANLRVLLSSAKQVASTSINIKGGDTTAIETKDEYYRVFGPLEAVPSEGIFRLKDTGSFSSIRSLGGFAGKAIIEFSLGQIVSNGDIRAVTDGSRNTFWAGAFYSPAPVKADQNDVPWLPKEYRHGFACLLTYYLDRPSLATEVFIEPVTTEPMDLVSISWTPINVVSSLQNGDFASSGGWSFSTTASYASSALGQGVASGACMMSYSSSGYASQTFAVTGSNLASGYTSMTSAGRRCQINYNMRGRGDLLAGVRIVWLNVSGEIVEYKLKEDFPSGFFTAHRLVDYIPTNAVSGRIDVGIFSPCTLASAFIDNVEIYLGEKEFACQETVDRPKTISLPEIARSGRFSFVLAQRNPRREVLAKEATSINTFSIESNQYVDSGLQKTINTFSDNLKDPGPGTSIFCYRLGMKELDLRYREHIPRGSIVTLPLFTRNEIRQIWLTTELGDTYNDTTKFYVYPFADNPKQKIEIIPFSIGETNLATTTQLAEGEILRIHTQEESDAGWLNPLDKTFITDIKTITQNFDGTDREGKIRLDNAPHIRKVMLRDIGVWLKNHSIWNSAFDPNLETIWGLPTSMQTTIDGIRNGTTTEFDINDLISTVGYIPVKVTITTDNWIASPDSFGRPDTSRVRNVSLETLSESTQVETIVETKEDTISYESWLNSATVNSLFEILYGADWINNPVPNKNRLASGKSIETLKTLTLKQSLDGLSGKVSIELDTWLRNAYAQLKAEGKLSKMSNVTHTTTSAVETESVYATKYKPIITGPSGSFVKLYWYDSTNAAYVPIPRSAYEVSNAKIGLIKILAAPPSATYTAVLADYKYLSTSNTEDHFSSIVSLASGSDSTTANITLTSRTTVVTRNMTDYENGRIPKLRIPNFDRLDKDYYPVIEYYITSDGDLKFSRDFFKHGDFPARFLIEYQTLGIRPRASIEVARSGSPAITPTIYNLSLRVRESSPLLLREI